MGQQLSLIEDLYAEEISTANKQRHFTKIRKMMNFAYPRVSLKLRSMISDTGKYLELIWGDIKGFDAVNVQIPYEEMISDSRASKMLLRPFYDAIRHCDFTDFENKVINKAILSLEL